MADEPDRIDTEKTSDTTIISDDSDDQADVADADQTAAEAAADEVDQSDQDDQDDQSSSSDRRARRRPRHPFGRLSHVGRALTASGLVVAALAGLSGWLGYRAYEQHEDSVLRSLLVQTARQGAVNLTTINFAQIDTDVQRILDLATGAFRDDFERRSKPFIELVKAAQSKSEGTVTDAGLESQQGDSGQVLVAVAVKSRTAAGEEAPREWRMRIEVKAARDEAKMTNVVFVP